MYRAHVNEKIYRQCQILMMRALKLKAHSGHENTITHEGEWISKCSHWTENDDSPPAEAEDIEPEMFAAKVDSPKIQPEEVFEDDDDDAFDDDEATDDDDE